MDTNSQDNISIHGIEILEFAIKPKSKDRDAKHMLVYNISADIKLKPEINLLIVFLHVNIQEKDYEVANFKTGIGFTILNFSEEIIQKKINDQIEYVVPLKLEATVRRVAISTTRGLMHATFKGTYLHNAILPFIPELIKPTRKTFSAPK